MRTEEAQGALFESLSEEFREDRGVVEGILAELGYTSRSTKRLAGRATGNVLRAVAGGAPGDLSLFRTLEALAIGVQGKRCLWRAAQALVGLAHPAGRRSFVDLEADAVRQWETIERHRRLIVPGDIQRLTARRRGVLARTTDLSLRVRECSCEMVSRSRIDARADGDVSGVPRRTAGHGPVRIQRHTTRARRATLEHDRLPGDRASMGSDL